MTKGDGKPCKRCGGTEWYKSGHCIRCTCDRGRDRYMLNTEEERISRKKRYANNPKRANELAREWQKANPEKVKDINRKWYLGNSDKAKENRRKRYAANPERHKESVRKWQKANPEARTAQDNRRRTRKTLAGGSFTAAEWKALVEHYGGKCLRCGRTDVKLAADHVIPVAKGGTSNIDNIQPLCKPCNSHKHDKTIDYRPESGLGRWIQRKLFG